MTRIDEVGTRAALKEARRRRSSGDYSGALAACDRARDLLGAEGPPVLRALEALLRAEAEIERPLDPTALGPAAEVLTADGEWEDAAGAYGLLAREARARADLGAERRHLAAAIGCAEAGGAGVTGPSLLRHLALSELRAGNPTRAAAHVHRALDRLQGVMLLGARLCEAECLEVLGDALAALGDRTGAEARWRDALMRQEQLGRAPAVAAPRTKLRG